MATTVAVSMVGGGLLTGVAPNFEQEVTLTSGSNTISFSPSVGAGSPAQGSLWVLLLTTPSSGTATITWSSGINGVDVNDIDDAASTVSSYLFVYTAAGTWQCIAKQFN